MAHTADSEILSFVGRWCQWMNGINVLKLSNCRWPLASASVTPAELPNVGINDDARLARDAFPPPGMKRGLPNGLRGDTCARIIETTSDHRSTSSSVQQDPVGIWCNKMWVKNLGEAWITIYRAFGLPS